MKSFTRMKNSKFSFTVLLLLSLLLACVFFAGGETILGSSVEASDAQPINNLPIGARVMDPSWQWEFRALPYYTFQTGDVTRPVTWIVVAKNHYGRGSGVTLLSESVIGSYTFDDSTNRGSTNGSNLWGKSGTPNANHGLQMWLNSHGIHAGEGFYHAMPESFKNNVLITDVPCRSYPRGSSYTVKNRVFIPSYKELNMTEGETHVIMSGSVFPYFEKARNADRIAGMEGKGRVPYHYWTRDPYKTNPTSVATISQVGDWSGAYARTEHVFVRPVVNLKSETPVSITPDRNGIYTIKDASTLPPPPPPLTVNLKADPEHRQEAGKDMIFTAEVTNGKQNAEFRFTYQVPGSSVKVGQHFSTKNTWVISTTKYVGKVKIGVQARAIGSDVISEDFIDYEIIKVRPVEAVELTANPQGSQQAGEFINFTAEVIQGNENAEYAFYYKVPGRNWTLGRKYQQNNTWQPKTKYVGEAQIAVIARAVGSDKSYEARDIIDYEITAPK